MKCLETFSILILFFSMLSTAFAAPPKTQPKPKWICPNCAFKCPITTDGTDDVRFDAHSFTDLLDQVYADDGCHYHNECQKTGSKQHGWFLEGIVFRMNAMVLDTYGVPAASPATLAVNDVTILVPRENFKQGGPAAEVEEWSCTRVS